MLILQKEMCTKLLQNFPRMQEPQLTASSDHGYSISSVASADHTYSIEKEFRNKSEHCLHPALYVARSTLFGLHIVRQICIDFCSVTSIFTLFPFFFFPFPFFSMFIALWLFVGIENKDIIIIILGFFFLS